MGPYYTTNLPCAYLLQVHHFVHCITRTYWQEMEKKQLTRRATVPVNQEEKQVISIHLECTKKIAQAIWNINQACHVAYWCHHCLQVCQRISDGRCLGFLITLALNSALCIPKQQQEVLIQLIINNK